MRKITQKRDNAFLIALGDAVRNRRMDLLISQETLAEAAQLYRTYITEIEAGQRNLSTLTLLRIAEALSLPLSELILATEAILK